MGSVFSARQGGVHGAGAPGWIVQNGAGIDHVLRQVIRVKVERRAGQHEKAIEMKKLDR